MAREMSFEPILLVASQPTRGVDIGAQEFIYSQLLEARGNGKAVLLVSADLDEILSLADRIGDVVMPIPVARLDGNKELAGVQAARIIAKSGELTAGRRVQKLPASGGEEIIQIDHGSDCNTRTGVVQAEQTCRALAWSVRHGSGRYGTRTCDLLLVREAL